jgi:hypothetical protein
MLEGFMKKIPLLTLFFFILSQSAMATMVVNLNGGNIRPEQQFIVKSKDLTTGTAYDVTCPITDENNAKNPVEIFINGWSGNGGFTLRDSTITLNGQAVGHSYTTTKLTAIDNTLTIANVIVANIDGLFNIKNDDKNDSISVHCVATPH